MILAHAEVEKNSNPAADERPDLFHVEQIDCGLRIGYCGICHRVHGGRGGWIRDMVESLKSAPPAFRRKRPALDAAVICAIDPFF